MQLTDLQYSNAALVIADKTGVPPKVMRSKTKIREHVAARHLLWACLERAGFSYNSIAVAGGYDHSTVRGAVHKYITPDEDLARAVAKAAGVSGPVTAVDERRRGLVREAELLYSRMGRVIRDIKHLEGM